VKQTQFQDAKRLSHAYIIAAPTREEAVDTARHLAAAAVCLSAGPVPCGMCRACQKAKAGIHPDIVTVSRPEDEKGRPKKEIGVDQIRAMAADAWVLPNESERKVYLIEDADTMNLAAQNAALKLLEEPPAGVHFLLCVTNSAQLLPTVRSRCAELLCTGGEEQQDPELQKLAEEFLKLTLKRDRAELLRWCSRNEGMDNRTATAFLDCLSACTAQRLTGRKEPEGWSRKNLMDLIGLLDRCGAYLQVNTGVKHIFGLLAVDAIADDEKQRSQH